MKIDSSMTGSSNYVSRGWRFFSRPFPALRPPSF